MEGASSIRLWLAYLVRAEEGRRPLPRHHRRQVQDFLEISADANIKNEAPTLDRAGIARGMVWLSLTEYPYVEVLRGGFAKVER